MVAGRRIFGASAAVPALATKLPSNSGAEGLDLLELCRYVVLKPVRANLVERPAQWSWGNYRATAGLSTAPARLGVDWTLSMFARTRTVARLRYRRIVRAGRRFASPLKAVEGRSIWETHRAPHA
jgi:hypothetical protein